MDELRKLEDFGPPGASTAATCPVPGNDDVLELVWELDPLVLEAGPSLDISPTLLSELQPKSPAGQHRSELLLDHELDPSEEPQLEQPLQSRPYFLVSVPGPTNFAANSEPGSKRERRNAAPAPASKPAARTLIRLLDQARALASAADALEGRSRGALYDAIGRAYDVALAAKLQPGELEVLLRSAGIASQPRTAALAIAKLVFGSAYDKTRLSEYAAVLSHAQRLGLGFGALAQFLREAPGGLKRVVAQEREQRRSDAGAANVPRTVPRTSIAKRLRGMPVQRMDALAATGDEFSLVLVRRLPDGTAALLGEIPRNLSLLERAARSLADGRG